MESFAAAHMAHHPAPGESIANERDFHAFALLGKETLFASHLTMLDHEPHMYQMVIQISLPEPWRLAFIKEREAHPEDSYFIANTQKDPKIGNDFEDPMTVSELASRLRTSFVANIFRGVPYKKVYDSWPWNGVRPVLANIPISIDRIVHFHPFAWTMNYPDTLIYLLFGAGPEAHMVNLQTRKPDFDHVLSLANNPDWLARDMLQAGILVDLAGVPRLQPGDQTHRIRCANPIADRSTIDVRYRCADPRRPVTIGRTTWFCVRVGNHPDPCEHCVRRCATETPAGFIVN
jgi:hypothetical protein